MKKVLCAIAIFAWLLSSASPLIAATIRIPPTENVRRGIDTILRDVDGNLVTYFRGSIATDTGFSTAGIVWRNIQTYDVSSVTAPVSSAELSFTVTSRLPGPPVTLFLHDPTNLDLLATAGGDSLQFGSTPISVSDVDTTLRVPLTNAAVEMINQSANEFEIGHSTNLTFFGGFETSDNVLILTTVPEPQSHFLCTSLLCVLALRRIAATPREMRTSFES